jgi:hypothetical protein
VTIERTLDKDAMRRRGRELRALLNEWDPIGIIGPSGPDDEYDCLLWPLMRLLERGVSQENIAEYLGRELNEHFGLSIPADTPQFAGRVKAWYETTWAGTRVPGSGPDLEP